MYRKILIALDGSSISEQVLPYARSVARALELPVDLMAVVDDVALAALLPPAEKGNVEQLVAEAAGGSAAYLDRIAATFRDLPVTCSVLKGMAGEVIVKEAERDGGTLIAMATHGRSGIDRWLLGSVTEKVMRGTTNPLLLVRAVDDGQREGEALIKTVIVPLDGSPVAEKALPHALALATTMDLSLLLFGVYQLTQIISPSNRLLAAIKGEAASYLEEKVRELKRASVRVSELLVEGDAGDQIVDLACSAANSLVVICSHGRSGVRRWALGSVAERVLRHCSAPVLLVRSV